MARALPRPPYSRTLALPIALCLLIAVAPTAWLEVISPVPWQHEIVHLTGLVGIGVAAVWPWSRRQDPASTRRFYVWLLLGTATLSIYVVSASPMFLLIGFSSLFAGLLDISMARAHVASREYRDRLERRMNS